MAFRLTKCLGSILVLLGLSTQLVHADEMLPREQKELGSFTIQFENDLFAGSDQHYTNGIRLSWLSPEGDSLEPINLLRDLLEAVTMDEHDELTRFGLAVGQEMYTPIDRERVDLIVSDRPYAGWLYGAMSLHTISPYTVFSSEGKTLESVELQLGVVGPLAFGKEAQDLVHDIRLIERFNGWGNQLGNEPGMLLAYERKWRPGKPIQAGPLQFDYIPRAGVSVGNILTHANVGGVVRLGYNLPEDFGPPSLIKGVFPLDHVDPEKIGLYMFVSGEGRVVAQNIFLDGNTFSDSHYVGSKPIVGDIAIGAAVMIGRFRVAYTHAFRSREFEGQDRYSRFGSLSASFQAAF